MNSRKKKKENFAHYIFNFFMVINIFISIKKIVFITSFILWLATLTVLPLTSRPCPNNLVLASVV